MALLLSRRIYAEPPVVARDQPRPIPLPPPHAPCQSTHIIHCVIFLFTVLPSSGCSTVFYHHPATNSLVPIIARRRIQQLQTLPMPHHFRRRHHFQIAAVLVVFAHSLVSTYPFFHNGLIIYHTASTLHPHCIHTTSTARPLHVSIA